MLHSRFSSVIYFIPGRTFMGFLGDSAGTESTCNVGDLCSIPGLGRSSGEENGNTLQYSCLGNSMDRGPRWATVHGVGDSDMIERLVLSLFFIISLRIKVSLFLEYTD